ncbi:Uncharacterized protein FWK35_00018810 [Aphis craccivora]|uniref:Uncharacterized protein n=1 Tax=Aphis craccivora TaxID=307492 RepID=A0A6G0XZZ7_APHCR|nr:Uncharacterized protein FWK35_00018810 [Aphis craccivora]
MDKIIDEWLLKTGKPDVLKLNNVVYASTCNLVEVMLGIMNSSLFLTVFTLEDFSNKYLRFSPATGGIVTNACKYPINPIEHQV